VLQEKSSVPVHTGRYAADKVAKHDRERCQASAATEFTDAVWRINVTRIESDIIKPAVRVLEQ
jgi:hypothetical protein